MSFTTTLLLHGTLMFVLTLPLLGCDDQRVREGSTRPTDRTYGPNSPFQAPKNSFLNDQHQWAPCKVGQGGSTCGNPHDTFRPVP